MKEKIGFVFGRHYTVEPYLQFAYRLLKNIPHPIIIDIGANIGTTSIPLAIKFPSSLIFAIEPHPTCLHQLMVNKQLNKVDQLQIISCAIHEKNSFAKMTTDSLNDGGHSLVQNVDGNDKTFLVRTLTLKELFTELNINHCHILKIDAEGWDYSILRSLGELGHPNRVENIIVEYNALKMQALNIRLCDLIHLGEQMDFGCRMLHNGRSISSTDCAYAFQNNREILDLIFTKPSHS